MRVLFLHASWHSSSEYRVHQLLAEHVDPDLVDCHFIWQAAMQGQAKHDAPRLARPGRTVYWDFGRDMSVQPKPSKAHRALLMLSRLPHSLRFFGRQIRAIRPDVIYTSQQSYEVWLAQWLSRRYRIPHLIHISYPVGPWLGRLTLRAIRRTPHLIACSKFVRRSALSAGVAPRHVETLHHGANVHRFDVPKDRASLRAAFHWAPDTPVVTVAARLDPHKGYPLLLAAFAQVQQEMPETRLLILGKSTTGSGHGQKIKQRARNLNLNGAVKFAGFRSDLPQIFAGTDVFCLPTENDALPLVFLAAMAAGLPTVACTSGGVPEMVLHGETGLLSPLGDVDGLAANLLKVLRDRGLAQRLGTAGKERAFTAFAPDRIAAQWAEILYDRFDRSQG